MRAILIDPKAKTITEVEYTGDYKNINEHIEAELFTVVGIDHYENEDRESLFVDDEGLYKEDQYFFLWNGYDQPLAGKGLILGYNAEGESIATSLGLDYVTSMVKFIDVELSHFEDVSGTTNWLGKEVPMVGHRTIFKPKGPQ
jgi:hypothetical protein